MKIIRNFIRYIKIRLITRSAANKLLNDVYCVLDDIALISCSHRDNYWYEDPHQILTDILDKSSQAMEKIDNHLDQHDREEHEQTV